MPSLSRLGVAGAQRGAGLSPSRHRSLLGTCPLAMGRSQGGAVPPGPPPAPSSTAGRGSWGPQPPHKAVLHENRGPGGSASLLLPASGPQKGASFPRPAPLARLLTLTPVGLCHTRGDKRPPAWGHRSPQIPWAEKRESPWGCPPKVDSVSTPAPAALRETEAGGEGPWAAPRRASSPGWGAPLLSASAPLGVLYPPHPKAQAGLGAPHPPVTMSKGTQWWVGVSRCGWGSRCPPGWSRSSLSWAQPRH